MEHDVGASERPRDGVTVPPRSERFLTVRHRTTGTRFWVHPHTGLPAEIVYVNAPPGAIKAGPEDDRMYVLDARNKTPYYFSGGWPPYTGLYEEAAAPGPDGHFDHITPDHEAFSSATVFATVRCVLDIWEHYLGRRVRWYFRDAYPRLEVIPSVLLERNAISMFGYLECGFRNLDRRAGPLCRNFDIVAHEVGHIVLKDVIGYPAFRTLELRAHEEAAADLVAIVAALHFPSVVDRLLQRTNGDLFTPNELARIGELGRSREIRNAFNNKRMSQVRWDPDLDQYRYKLALPFLGAVFDIFVEIYQDNLVRRGAITRKLADESENLLTGPIRAVQAKFARRFTRNPGVFTRALVDARDTFARLLTKTWQRTSSDNFAFARVVGNMLDADLELHRGRYRKIIQESFLWRDIVSPPAARAGT